MVLRSIFFFLIFFLSFSSILLGQRVKNDTVLSTGIETKREMAPSLYRVTWIKWDSDFRKSDLRIGDQIIGLNDVYYKEDEFNRGNLGLGIGDYLESTYWERRQAQSHPGKQREDAEKFVGQAIQILKEHLDAFEDQYKKFVNEFDHIFLGPVGNQTIDELLERNQWEKWSDDVERINIGEFLEKLYDDANDWWGISLSDLDSHEKEAVRELIEKDLEKLEEKAKSAKDFSFIERFKLLIPNRKNLEEKSKK